MSGCGPQGVPEDQLGQVVFDVPDIPGTERPYILPSLQADSTDEVTETQFGEPYSVGANSADAPAEGTPTPTGDAPEVPAEEDAPSP